MKHILKTIILNILIFCMVAGVPMSAKADGYANLNDQVAENILHEAARNLTVDLVNKPPADNFLSGPSGKESKIVQKILLMLVSKLVLGVKRRLNEKNLEINSQNVRNEAKLEAADLSTNDVVVIEALSGLTQIGVWAITFKKWEAVLKNTFVLKWLVELTSVAVLTWGSNGLSDILSMSLEHTLKHPEQVGGLNEGEEIALNRLKNNYELGISYLLYGMAHGKPAVKSSYRKVFKVAKSGVFDHSNYSDRIMQNLFRELLLTGDSAMLALQIGIKKSLTSAIGGEGVGGLKGGARALLVMVLTVAIVYLTPDALKDYYTYSSRTLFTNYYWLRQNYDDQKLEAGLKTYSKVKNGQIEENIKSRRYRRESQVNYHLSLLGVALHEINFLSLQLRTIENSSVTNNNSLNSKNSLHDIYALGGFRVTYNGSEKALSSRFLYADFFIPKYREMFNATAQRILGTYQNEHATLLRLAAYAKDNTDKSLLEEDAARVLNVSRYLTSLIFNLQAGLTVNERHADYSIRNEDYESARRVLSRSLFWGLTESSALFELSAK
jgi:hypothetical protein